MVRMLQMIHVSWSLEK